MSTISIPGAFTMTSLRNIPILLFVLFYFAVLSTAGTESPSGNLFYKPFSNARLSNCIIKFGIIEELKSHFDESKRGQIASIFDEQWSGCKGYSTVLSKGLKKRKMGNVQSLSCSACCIVVETAASPQNLAKLETELQDYVTNLCQSLPDTTKTACLNFAKNSLGPLLKKYLSDTKKIATIGCQIADLCPLNKQC